MSSDSPAYAAFKMFYPPQPPFSAEPTAEDLNNFAAALDAATVDDALAAIGVTQGDPTLASPHQDRQNYRRMEKIRRDLSRSK